MAKNRGTSSFDELDVGRIRRDARPFYIRATDWLKKPDNAMTVLAFSAVIAFRLPALVFPISLFYGLFYAIWSRKKDSLPVRIPLAAGIEDPSDPISESRKFKKGSGIMYLGYDREVGGDRGQVYVGDSDARQHMFALGTTGSGKTQALLSWVYNAISWGSSFVYIDGKADVNLIFQSYAMVKSVNRQDDWFLVNFMTGDSDAFEQSRSSFKGSNTINPFASGSSNSLTQLVSSLMPESGGDNAMWQGLAISMVNAVIIALCYKRFSDGFTIDAGVLRDYIELGKLVDLTREFSTREDINQELVFKPLQTYLLNLPGFDWEANLNAGEPVSEDTKKQHDFRSMQFLRQLTMLADTYGAVFRAQIPEISMLDVVLKRRFVIVAIPSLEKSEEESQGVGKLVVSSLKLMMAKTLGSASEGDYDKEVESRPTNAPTPFLAVFDELGYYMTKGMAIMFAQARGLGFGLIAAAQDLAALQKGPNKEETKSVIANTRFKCSLAMEDPDETADLIIKSGGKAMVSEVAGYEGKMGSVTSSTYRDNLNATIQERSRVTLEELRDMNPGESILMWKDKIIRMRNFYVFAGPGAVKMPKSIRLNRLIGSFPPGVGELQSVSAQKTKTAIPALNRILQTLVTPGRMPRYSGEPDDIGDDILVDSVSDVDVNNNLDGIGVELGLYYRALLSFEETARGTKRGARTGRRGVQLTPLGQKEAEPDEMPVIEETKFEFDFDQLFTSQDEPEYPVRPVLNETRLELDFSEFDAAPKIGLQAWEAHLDSVTRETVETLDVLLSADKSSTDSIKDVVQYRPSKEGFILKPGMENSPSLEATRSGF